MRFSKWVKESEKEMKPLIEKFGTYNKVMIKEGYEEKLLQQYLTFKMVRATWILVIITVLISLLGAILNFITLMIK